MASTRDGMNHQTEGSLIHSRESLCDDLGCSDIRRAYIFQPSQRYRLVVTYCLRNRNFIRDQASKLPRMVKLSIRKLVFTFSLLLSICWHFCLNMFMYKHSDQIHGIKYYALRKLLDYEQRKGH